MFLQLIHAVVDKICCRTPPKYTDYSEIWSLEEWWQLMDSYTNILVESVSKGHINKDQVRLD